MVAVCSSMNCQGWQCRYGAGANSQEVLVGNIARAIARLTERQSDSAIGADSPLLGACPRTVRLPCGSLTLGGHPDGHGGLDR
jgi:hypothetical protein